MNVTTAGLTKAAGAAAVVAGTIFAAVQIGHPPLEAATAETTEWVVRSWAKALMAALALAGFTGLYLHVRRRTGLLGLAGYLVLSAGYLLMFAVEVIAATVLPVVVAEQPGYVDDVLVTAAGGTPAGDIGGVQAVLALSGAGYMLGGLLFGIALFRSGTVARWAAALLAIGTVGTAALAVLPESFNRPFAVPVGVALIGLGASLWRRQDVTAEAPSARRAVPVGAVAGPAVR